MRAFLFLGDRRFVGPQFAVATALKRRNGGWMKELKMQFEAGASAVGEAGGATGASSGGSPAPQTGAAAPAATPPSATGAGAETPRTYRDEDVQRIVRERLADEQKRFAPYRELGDASEVRARLERLDRMEKAARGEVPQVTPEQKELRDLLTKEFPGIDKVKELEARLEARDKMEQASRAQAGRSSISRMAQEKLGTSDPKVLKMLENVISASIAEDSDSLKAWNSGDISVIDKHFESVLSGSFDPLFKSASARYSSGKAKDKAEVPPTMPKGGVQAPASSDRKLSNDERRDAAWKRLQELEGQA